jgi:hypothetical protein
MFKKTKMVPYKNKHRLSRGTVALLQDGSHVVIDADDWECCETGMQEINYYVFHLTRESEKTLENLNYDSPEWDMISGQDIVAYSKKKLVY